MKPTARHHNGVQCLTPEGIKRISRWSDPEFCSYQDSIKRSRRLFFILLAFFSIEMVGIVKWGMPLLHQYISK